MRRNSAFLIFQFLLPSIQVALFCLAIGKSPQNIHLAVVNQDRGQLGLNLGQDFIALMTSQNPNGFIMDYFTTTSEALGRVRNGKAWGVMSIPQNFTIDLQKRFTTNASQDVIDQSTIVLNLDMSDQQISVFISEAATDAFQAMAKQYTKAAQLPIYLGTPVYGPPKPKFTDFIAPGMVITISFAQSIGLTAVAFVLDKKTGNLDRSWACGLRPSELLSSSIAAQLVIVTVQVLLLLVFALYVFNLPMEGSFALVLFLALLLAMTGMMLGLLISAACEQEQTAMQLAMGCFFPTLLLSGIIWPVEAIPTGLNYISLALPTTWAANAMRSIMSRGWGMGEQEVWAGFAITGAWITFCFFFAVRSLKSVN